MVVGAGVPGLIGDGGEERPWKAMGGEGAFATGGERGEAEDCRAEEIDGAAGRGLFPQRGLGYADNLADAHREVGEEDTGIPVLADLGQQQLEFGDEGFDGQV